MDEHRALREAHIHWILSIEPNGFLTLGAGLSIRPETLNGKVKHFFQRIERLERGRNYAKWPASKRPIAFGFHEHPDTNPHMHLLVCAEPDLMPYLRGGERLWRELRRAGDYHFEDIRDTTKAARYVTKAFRPLSSDCEWFVYGVGGPF